MYRVARSSSGEAELILEKSILSEDIKKLANREGDQVGYLSEDSPSGGILYEVIATGLAPKGDFPAGTVVIGMPLANMNELFSETDANGHGLLVSDVLHGGPSVPDGVLSDLKNSLSSEKKRGRVKKHNA